MPVALFWRVDAEFGYGFGIEIAIRRQGVSQ